MDRRLPSPAMGTQQNRRKIPQFALAENPTLEMPNAHR